MAEKRLNQVVAVEKDVSKRVTERLSEAYKTIQKPVLFDGQTKTYQPKATEGEDAQPLPAENQRVQHAAEAMLRDAAGLFQEGIDAPAPRDWANCEAKADVVVDGKKVLAGAPVSFLLYLEKQLIHLHTFVEKLPTLDPAFTWSRDDGTGLFRAESVQTTKTKKVQRPIVLYPATVEHPAQTQLITEDVNVGTWTLTKHSGAIQETRQRVLLERVNKLLRAVKEAREEANSIKINERQVAEGLFAFVLA